MCAVTANAVNAAGEDVSFLATDFHGYSNDEWAGSRAERSHPCPLRQESVYILICCIPQKGACVMGCLRAGLF